MRTTFGANGISWVEIQPAKASVVAAAAIAALMLIRNPQKPQ